MSGETIPFAASPEEGQPSPIKYQLADLNLAMNALRQAQERARVVGQALREQGATYQELAEAAGISTQAAHQRWSVNGKQAHRERQRALRTSAK